MPSFSSSRRRAQIVALAGPASRVGQEFRHQKQRDAAAAGRRVRGARQHHVDDVVGEIVVAVGDEDLLAGDPVMLAPPLRPGIAPRASAARRDPSPPAARSGSSSRSTRPRPAFRDRAASARASRAPAAGRSRRNSTAGTAPSPCRPSSTSRRPGSASASGSPWPPCSGSHASPHPAGLDIAPIGLAKAGRRAHHAVFEDAADPVARLVERLQFRRGETCRLVKDRVRKIGGKIGAAVPQPRHRVDHEAHLGERGGIRHRSNSSNKSVAKDARRRPAPAANDANAGGRVCQRRR